MSFRLTPGAIFERYHADAAIWLASILVPEVRQLIEGTEAAMGGDQGRRARRQDW